MLRGTTEARLEWVAVKTAVGEVFGKGAAVTAAAASAGGGVGGDNGVDAAIAGGNGSCQVGSANLSSCCGVLCAHHMKVSEKPELEVPKLRPPPNAHP